MQDNQTIINKINGIKEKIKRKIETSNFSFSIEEKKYIEYIPELSTLAHAKLSETGFIMDKAAFEFAKDQDFELTGIYLFNLAMAAIEYDPEVLIQDFNQIIEILHNQELVDKLKSTAYAKIPELNPNHQDQISVETSASQEKVEYTQEKLKELFQNKDYETISQIKKPVHFDHFATIYEEFVTPAKDYPYEKYGFPIALENIAYEFEDKIPFMRLNGLAIVYRRAFLEYSDSKEKILRIILNKIQSVNDLKEIEDYELFLQELCSYNNYYLLSKFTEKFLELGIDVKIALKSENNLSDMSLEEFDKLVDELIKNDVNFYLFKESLRPTQLPSEFKESKKFLNLLIQHKEYLSLFEIFENSPFANEMDEAFKQAINSKDEKLKKILENQMFSNKNVCRIYERYLDTIIDRDLHDVNSTNYYGNTYLNFILITTNIWNYQKDKILEYMGKVPIDNIIKTVEPPLQEKDFVEIFNNYLAYEQYYPAINYVHTINIEVIANAVRQNTGFAYELVQSLSYVADDWVVIEALLSRQDPCTLAAIDYINHHQDNLKIKKLFNKEFYEKSKEFICAIYGYEIAKLDCITDVVGYSIIGYLDNENLKTLLSMPIENIKKILALITTKEFTNTDLIASYDAIKQYEFSKKYNDIVEVFPSIMHSIEDVKQGICHDEEASYHQKLLLISKAIDQEFINQLVKKYNINADLASNPLELLEFICRVIKDNQDKSSEYTDILHEITSYYIAKQREEYRSTYNVYKDLDMPYEVDQKVQINLLVDIIIKSIDCNANLTSRYTLIDPDYYQIFTDLNNQGIDNTLIIDVINYLKDPNAQLTNDISLVKKNIKFIKDAVKKYVTNHYFEITSDSFKYNGLVNELKKACADDRVKKTYSIEQSKTDLCMLLLELRFDILSEKILADEKIYNTLLDIMNKRKILSIPEIISNYINSTSGTDVKYDSSYIIAFINYFYKICEQINVETLNLPNILKTSQSYAGVSSVYSIVLGDEDARLIMANRGHNSAKHKTSSERLNESLDLTIQNFERQEITIPTFNEVLTNNGKSMRVIVGNFTHPSNLTHGERTDACMRIGGVGDSLFYFALGNVNGFHIRFEDPETGKYISRVSGFRNGNTVFLNELRNTCDPEKYNDQEIIEFCRIAAKKLIELSKDSPCPIDNVVVHRAYATDQMKEPEINLGVKDIKEGLPTFYSDVNSSAILLASSNPNGSLVPVNLDKTKVPTYKVAREKILVSSKIDEMTPIINRIHAINEYLKNRTFSNVEALDYQSGFLLGMANQDWYVYIDENNMIHSEIIDIDKRAQVEYSRALQEAEEYVNLRIVEKSGTYGL